MFIVIERAIILTMVMVYKKRPQDQASGVYWITNIITGHRYVGSSSDIFRRFDAHKYLLRKRKHPSSRLQNAWDKYGADNFIFEPIEAGIPPAELIQREQLWIDVERCLGGGYNIRTKAESQRGYRHSVETREKMSIANKKRFEDPDYRKRHAEIRRGQVRGPMSEDQKRRMSTDRKGKQFTPMTPEIREKLRIANTGKKHAVEAREKISASKMGKPSKLKGRKRSEEAIASVAEGIRRYYATVKKEDRKKRPPISDETRLRMSAASKLKKPSMKGKSHSAETKALMSEKAKARLAKGVSVETRAKMSEAGRNRKSPGGMSGKKHSAETRRKIAENRWGRSKIPEARAC